MVKIEKYPENMPWDSESNADKSLKLQWMLTKDDNEYIFSKSKIDDRFIYIQRNRGKKEAVNEYLARFTYQRLFDEGFLLAAVA